MGTISAATVVWTGDLMSGKGEVSSESHTLTAAPVSWAQRAEARSTSTSPEELLAAAHAACFSMAFSARLAKNGTPPTRLDVTAKVSFDKGDAGFAITTSALEVVGVVPGIDGTAFSRIADDAKDNCPVSAALRGNVKLTVNARLA